MVRFVRRLARRFIYGIPFLLLVFLRIRFISITHPDRIGHLCIEPDCFLKEGELGLRPHYRAVLLLPEGKVANRALLNLWGRYVTVITSKLLCLALRPLASLPHLSYPMAPYAVAIGETARGPMIYAKWANRGPLLSLDEEALARGRDALALLGLPRDSWFVCVHSREGGYSPADEHLHSFRNSDIERYRLAMQTIVDRGGRCVRVGEETSKPLVPMRGVIDYAHSGMKSDWMDVFLCSQCLFFLGNSSGLCLAATVFGRPSALANLTPVSSTLPVGYGDIGIPKLLRRRATGELFTFAEVLQSPVGNYRFAAEYEADGIAVEENAPEDIRDLALEMLERLQGSVGYTEVEESLQQRFNRLLKPGHYSFGAASRVGRDFLRKYASLLEDA